MCVLAPTVTELVASALQAQSLEERLPCLEALSVHDAAMFKQGDRVDASNAIKRNHRPPHPLQLAPRHQ